MGKWRYVSLVCIASSCLWGGLASAETFSEYFHRSNDTVRSYMCAPVLTKMYALLQTTLEEGIGERGISPQEATKRTSFAMNVGYRARALDTHTKAQNSMMNDYFWKLSASADSEEYKNLAGGCVSLYNQMRKANSIREDEEAAAVEYIRADMKKAVAR